MASSPPLSEPNDYDFGSFYNGWLARHEAFVERLLTHAEAENQPDFQQLQALIEQVLLHYECYYEQKMRSASGDVFLFFSAPWLTSFERAFQWIGDFKPTLIFRFLRSSVDGLSTEQSEAIERMRKDTARREKELADAMAMVQERVATPPILGLLRQSAGRLRNGEVSFLEAATGELKVTMTEVMERANGLRAETVTSMMEVLRPVQTAKLLAAAGQFQIRIRRWGLQRDAQRSVSTD